MPLLLVASLLLVRPGAPSSVLAPSSDALVTSSFYPENHGIVEEHHLVCHGTLVCKALSELM